MRWHRDGGCSDVFVVGRWVLPVAVGVWFGWGSASVVLMGLGVGIPSV